VLVFILFLWFLFLRSENIDNIALWKHPARHAEEVIVDFVSSHRASPMNPGGIMVDGIEKQLIGPMISAIENQRIAPGAFPTRATSVDDPTPNPKPIRLPDPPPQRSTSWKRFLTVATMVKNQRRWLREWIEFYRLMGVEHFIIYDNESTDQSLEILQYYIEEGIVDYIPWPPKEVPPPIPATTKFEYWQDSWFRDSLETCLNNDWVIHRQGPCQLAAFTDAIRRTKGGISRWLGIWDVDEYIYPRQECEYNTVADLLKAEYQDATHIRFWGNVFGTNGHVEAARRKPGSPLHALLTEEYTRRAELDRISSKFVSNVADHNNYPFQKIDAHNIEVHGRGKLATVTFGGGDAYARKSLADPDLVSHSWIHHFEAPGNVVCLVTVSYF
jgi:hypothetical protein